MKLVQVWAVQVGAPGFPSEPIRLKIWLPERLALAGGYELVVEGE